MWPPFFFEGKGLERAIAESGSVDYLIAWNNVVERAQEGRRPESLGRFPCVIDGKVTCGEGFLLLKRVKICTRVGRSRACALFAQVDKTA
jgi:hypothetical protein